MARARRALTRRENRHVERDANYLAVGAFVLLVCALAGFFVYWYSDGRDRRSYEQYEIYFQGNVTGLSEGGSVRYLGVDIGRVRRIRVDQRSPERVQVVANIDRSAPISDQTTAQLSLMGVTGLLYINLRQNVDQREVMPPVPSEKYPVINTVNSDFDTFLSTLPVIAGRAAEVLLRLQQIFSVENSADMAAMIENLKATTDQMPATLKHVDTLVTELTGTSAEIRRVAAQLNETIPSLGPKVWDLTEKLGATAENLERASATIEQMLAENRSGITGFTQNGLPELERTLREARAAAEQFQELSRNLNEDPSRILYQPGKRGVEVPR
jgi:phospholipid/cholesterol/gamma-HCH transport system substrate-binding protein